MLGVSCSLFVVGCLILFGVHWLSFMGYYVWIMGCFGGNCLLVVDRVLFVVVA